jgi:hypothetical protein
MGIRPKGLKPTLFLLALTIPAAGCYAMDIQGMLAQAVANDVRTKALSGVLANTLIDIERAGLAPGFQLKLSTGDIRFGYSFNPDVYSLGPPVSYYPPWQISVAPSASLLLGRKTETEVNVQVPLIVYFGPGMETRGLPLPAMNIRQPLDKLKRDAKKLTKLQEEQNRYASEKARIDVLNRVNEVQRSLFSQISSLVSLEQARRELEQKLADATDTLEKGRKLKSFAEGSIQQRQAEFAVTKLQRELELSKRRYANAWKQLEGIVGQPVDSLPVELPEPALALPDPGQADRNPDVYLASLLSEVERLRLQEKIQPAKPKFYLGSTIGSAYSDVLKEYYYTIGSNLQAQYEDFTVSAGLGGEVRTATPFISMGFSYSFQDRKLKALDRKARENSLEVSRWNLTAARDAYLAAREGLALEIEELDLRRKSLEEDRTLSDLRLSEATRWLEQGYSTAKEVETLQWERQKLDYAARILKLDVLLVGSRLDALVSQDGAKP